MSTLLGSLCDVYAHNRWCVFLSYVCVSHHSHTPHPPSCHSSPDSISLYPSIPPFWHPRAQEQEQEQGGWSTCKDGAHESNNRFFTVEMDRILNQEHSQNVIVLSKNEKEKKKRSSLFCCCCVSVSLSVRVMLICESLSFSVPIPVYMFKCRLQLTYIA